ncbi:alpha/beta fold hydrolase [Kutzneria sp. CA-103260]|uniref:alpha/beta fold hydrolase n=1 Tax=Kutzneria sp. CA-103260 TaxID=2802641 RepID=UPI001BA46C20|nr:alpha/beta hydrolase [Kutzneria sp. CA-103260]QUQ72310.1 alpha/beta hydrolase [Kutzneria sp. CA-103260]
MKQIVEIDGVAQAYEVSGQGPVAIVHSGGPGIDSAYLRMPLLEQHLTMVYVDPIGTGQSGLLPGGGYSVATYAEFSRKLIEHLGATKPYFIGHSHGGFVGLELAMANPGLLGGLIAYSTATVYGPELFVEAGRQMAAFVRRWPDEPDAVRAGQAWTENQATGGESSEGEAAHTRFLQNILPAYFANYWATVAARGPLTLQVRDDPARKPDSWDGRDRLGRIDVPTLVVSGRYDFICPRQWSDQLVAGIPDTTYLRLDESGHFGYLEQQDLFVSTVAEFVK